MPKHKSYQNMNSYKYLDSDTLTLYYIAKQLSKEEFTKKLYTEFYIFFEILYKKMHTYLLYSANYYDNIQTYFDFEDVLHDFMIQDISSIFKTFNPYWNPALAPYQNLLNYLKLAIQKKYRRTIYKSSKKIKFENEAILENLSVAENTIAMDKVKDIKQCLEKKLILL